MPLIDWTDKMSVGVNEIDIQHKKLVDILNRLHDSLKANTTEKELKTIYMELIDYTKYHFSTEEKIMEEVGYENLEVHKKQHEKFVNKLYRMKERCHLGKEEISVELSSFLSGWVIGHIIHSDRDYKDAILNSEWYKKHGKSA